MEKITHYRLKGYDKNGNPKFYVSTQLLEEKALPFYPQYQTVDELAKAKGGKKYKGSVFPVGYVFQIEPHILFYKKINKMFKLHIHITPSLLQGATATAEFHTPANNEPQDLKQIWNTQNTKIDIWGEVDANDYNVALGYGSANLSYNGDQVEETLYFPIIEISNKNNPSDKLILVPNKNIEDIQDSYSKLADENEDPAQPTIYTWDISQFTSKHENCFSNNWYPYLQIEE